MTQEEIKLKFEEKLGKNYGQFLCQWLVLEPTSLIKKAEEIAATNLMLELLPETATPEEMEYLLRFENPLEVVRDKWIEENGSEMVHGEDLTHALWSIVDKDDAEQEYALDPEYAPPDQEQGVQMLC